MVHLLFEICDYKYKFMSKSQTKLKILLIGINKYQHPVRTLDGCEYDVKSILQTLKSIYKGQLIIEEKILLDEQATRDNIIHIFKTHFANLKKDDIALFYFSGHGSRREAPREFQHNYSNESIESLVCYNDTPNTIYELADKELSVLIWEATKVNGNTFTLILDCCHSGGIRKDESIKIKGARNYNKARSWRDYYGAENFYLNKGKITVPQGRYISLSACRNDQQAQEKYIDEKFQGVFTHILVKTLKKYKKSISYQELIDQMAIKVRSEAYSQNPQLSALLDEDLNCLFLSGNQRFDINNPIVFFNKNDREGMPIGWVLNKGSIHGVKKNIDGNQNGVWLYEEEIKEGNGLLNGKTAAKGKLVEIFPNFTTVFLPEELDRKKEYRVGFLDRFITPINIEINPGIDHETLISLKIKFYSTPFVTLKDSPNSYSYFIDVEHNQFVVKNMNKGLQCFTGIAGISDLGIKHLIECLRRIASWHNLKELVNSNNSIDKNDLKLDFYHVIEPGFNFMEAVKEIGIPNILEESPVLEHIINSDNDYLVDSQNVEGSLFKLKITNLSQSRLWVSTLYLGSDYSITNSLMPIEAIDSGESKWLEYYESSQFKSTKLIPLHIEDTFLRQGIYSITENFKIIASTQEFETFTLNQNAVFNVKNRLLGYRHPRFNFTPKDWLTLDFSVKLKALVQETS